MQLPLYKHTHLASLTVFEYIFSLKTSLMRCKMNTNKITTTTGRWLPEHEELQISKHATIRCQQRGLRPQDIRAISRHADICIPRGNGVELVRISKSKLSKMGKKTPEGVTVDRLKNTCLLLAVDNTVITAIHPRRGKYKRGRTQRRAA